MRKTIFTAFILVLACSFMVINGFQPVIAAEKSKYGGILKANHSKPAGVIGNPLKIRGWNHEQAASLEGICSLNQGHSENDLTDNG